MTGSTSRVLVRPDAAAVEHGVSSRRLRVLIELASSDQRMGAVNDVLDLVHFADRRAVQFFVCGVVDDSMRQRLEGHDVGVVRGQSVVISKLGLPLYLASVARWLATLVRLNPDVVHLNYNGHGPSLACAAYVCRIPVVGRAGPPPARPLNSWMSAFIANSQAHAADLLRSAMADKVRIAGDLVRFERLADVEPRSPLPPRVPGRCRFLFLGQLVERKGLHVLIDAMARMNTRDEAMLVGGDWAASGYVAERREQIARAGVGSRVHCLNHRTDVAALLHDCDVLVVPSLQDARPRVILEAMYMGKPVIAAAVGSIPDLLQHDVTGLLVPAGDAAALAAQMERVSGDAALRARLGAAARQEAHRRFDPRRTAAAYVDVYRQVSRRWVQRP